MQDSVAHYEAEPAGCFGVRFQKHGQGCLAPSASRLSMQVAAASQPPESIVDLIEGEVRPLVIGCGGVPGSPSGSTPRIHGGECSPARRCPNGPGPGALVQQRDGLFDTPAEAHDKQLVGAGL